MANPTTFAQFTKFGTDACETFPLPSIPDLSEQWSSAAPDQELHDCNDSDGLERTLRMLQALTLVFSHYSLPFNALLALLGLSDNFSTSPSSPQPAALRATLLGVRMQVALVRRVLRMFRCLEAFGSAWALYEGAQSSGGGGGASAAAETWLDVAARSFNGMYLLLEAAGLPDALGVSGLRAWGPERAAALNVEAQRFWFFALVCGLLAAMVRMFRILCTPSVSESGDGSGPRREDTSQDKGKKCPGNGADGVSHEDAPANGVVENYTHKELGGDDLWRSERDRLREVAYAQRAHRKQWREQVRARSTKVLRRMVADALDLAVPGAVLGWVPASPGLVGFMMLGSTYLTALDVWERCGREIAASQGKTG